MVKPLRFIMCNSFEILFWPSFVETPRCRLGFQPCSSSSRIQSSWRLRIRKRSFIYFITVRKDTNGPLLLHCSSLVVPPWCELMGVDMLLLDSQVSSLTSPKIFFTAYAKKSADVIELHIGVKSCDAKYETELRYEANVTGMISYTHIGYLS
ncbi:hypothetical protein Bca52824_054730 [Brassica carinata]|uniref:Uncharacterized protein n=1 Tax=Brassica carinata TaxID=52824 RepID=A0A8X7RAC3_BRACI|nr:hypothetical protein Bca52824_054730 [Brassica carinata]